MARIRSVKPQLRTDLTVAEWPREVRYAWVLLWGYLDDHGRGLDDLRLLVADLFPLDRDVTERKLDNWLKKMTADSIHGAAPLCRYEVDGRHYLHAVKWQHHQKVSHPQDSRIPSCPIHEQDANPAGADSEPLPNDSGTAPEPFALSRTPAEQGAGKRSREQGAGSRDSAPRGGAAPPAQPDTDNPISQVVAAYVDGARHAGQPIPAQTLRKRIGRQARELLPGTDLDALLRAAHGCGASGWNDLAVQLQRDAAGRRNGHAVGYSDPDRTGPAQALTADQWQAESASR
jgi:hypothetical protein